MAPSIRENSQNFTIQDTYSIDRKDLIVSGNKKNYNHVLLFKNSTLLTLKK